MLPVTLGLKQSTLVSKPLDTGHIKAELLNIGSMVSVQSKDLPDLVKSGTVQQGRCGICQ